MDLSLNNLRVLPEDIGQLKRLKVLDLYYNELDHLPESAALLLITIQLKTSPGK